MVEKLWKLRRPINGRIGDEPPFSTEAGLIQFLVPIAWQGLTGFEVTLPEGRVLIGAELESWFSARKPK
jgi:hypothetical protein